MIRKSGLLPSSIFIRQTLFGTLFSSLIILPFTPGAYLYLEREYLRIGQISHAKNLTIMHSLLGFAISMLLVFRTNTAYERWWEGRKLWGSLINNSRNLAIKLKFLCLPTTNIPEASLDRSSRFTLLH